MNLKRNKGITLVSLIVTIVLMMIISSTTIYVSLERFEVNNLRKMFNDLELLKEKVDNYYLQYGELPVLGMYTYSKLEFEDNDIDNEAYYIIDLKLMDGLMLNYGEEGYNSPNTSKDVYVVNKSSHIIYYVSGVKMNGTIYYYLLEDKNTDTKIPPTKPKINVISGEKDNEGKYTTAVEIEFVPGKSATSNIKNTVYSINGGEEKDISTLKNNILNITQTGEYNINIKTFDYNGSVSEKNEKVIIRITKSAKNIIPTEDYGKIVEYTSTIDKGKSESERAVKNWRIFYADNNNIYLIADDYIHADYCPAGRNGTLITANSDYKLSMYNIVNDYTGSSDIKDIRLKKLNNSYFFDREDKTTDASTDINMKAIAYMMDTNVWGGYKDEGGKADYAIAGPTIELLFASYNKKYNTDYRAKAFSKVGYKISKDGGANWDYYYSEMFSKADSLYVKSSTSKANAMWVACPSAQSPGYITDVLYSGLVAIHYNYYIPLGFRPLVCLKSNVQLVEKEDGSVYTIK